LLFLGEWGEALHEIDTQAAMMDAKAHYAQARANRLYRAFVQSFAMDFAAVRAICEPMLPALESPSDVQFCSMLIALAELNLGNYERAHALVSAAQEHMERQSVALDWYRRTFIESVLTELWLAKGDLTEARLAGERFLKMASATEERTWRTLAWETSARVAMAERDIARAQDCIVNGLSTMEGFELPLATWRVHATAFEFYRSVGDHTLTEHHRQLSRATIMKLAHSLPAEEPLRRRFLSAYRVRSILRRSKNTAAQAKGA
jgi:ATP/maltotriose-dependent transcriptional regulator MalT